MLFTDIRLQKYRSYEDSSFELGSGVNIVVGPNAAGKTNLLEAVMLSSIGKSYRARDNALIMTGQAWSRIDVHTSENKSRTVKLQNEDEKTVKIFQIDDKPYKKLPHNQKQPLVLFEPDSLQLLQSEPTHRRDYFDNLIEQYLAGYEQTRTKYKRVIAQRNALLKLGRPSTSQLFAWNLRTSELAEQIVAARVVVLEAINKNVSDIYSSISNDDKKVEIKYQSNITAENYGTGLLKKLEASLEQDLARGYTGSGPHRDDLMICFGDEPAIHTASRGEVRTLLLALKIIETQILEKHFSARPLILLDDVFSELDGARRKALTDYLSRYQTIITTTDADVVIKNFSKNASVILLQ